MLKAHCLDTVWFPKILPSSQEVFFGQLEYQMLWKLPRHLQYRHASHMFAQHDQLFILVILTLVAAAVDVWSLNTEATVPTFQP